MKQPWHVNNIKRRMASLPPISSDAFDPKIEEKKGEIKKPFANTSNSDRDRDDDSFDEEDEPSASPFQCLFCNEDFTNDDIGFTTNLEHMRTAHGMFIPDPEMVVDMQSFVGYLATEVRAWHECLYCGATKPTTSGIQSHMRDKGHCLLNLDREPELLDFWEKKPPWVDNGDDTAALEQELPNDFSATEKCIDSRRVAGSRRPASSTKAETRRRIVAPSTLTALPLRSSGEAGMPPLPQLPSRGRQLALHEEMSMLGVSTQQRRALVLAEKKAQRSEAVARRAREWIYAKGANSQKFDQVDNQAKWGKQNHKLLPR